MEYSAWLSLAAVCVLGAVMPGPSLFLVLHHTVSGTRWNGIMAGISHGLGIGVYAVMTVVGLSMVLEQFPWVFAIVKYLGVAFLLWLAWKALNHQPGIEEGRAIGGDIPLKESFWSGLMISFLNPKIAIFFIALFSQFVVADESWKHDSILVGTAVIIDITWYCLIATVLSHSALLPKLRKKEPLIHKISAAALVIVAARTVFL